MSLFQRGGDDSRPMLRYLAGSASPNARATAGWAETPFRVPHPGQAEGLCHQVLVLDGACDGHQFLLLVMSREPSSLSPGDRPKEIHTGAANARLRAPSWACHLVFGLAAWPS